MDNPVGCWFRSSRKREPVKLKLFCFPYAGGTTLIYKGWSDHLPSTVEVVAAELPGRGTRLMEPPFVSIPALIDALVTAINPLLDAPFAFFGHSMGAVIAFELARRVRKEYACEPQILLASGRRAPQTPGTAAPTYNLPRREFIDYLLRLEGTPREVLEHEELMELMIPQLRADFRMIQTYEYDDQVPLRCPISVFGGSQDRKETRELLLQWREQTTARFALHMLSGGHFFLRSARESLLSAIARELQEIGIGKSDTRS